MTPALTTAHRRRLRALWRSAGWPYQDPLEAELLAWGLLSRERDAAGRDTLRVTDAGVAVLAQTLQRNRAARGAHEALVVRVARQLQRAGRIAWQGLTLRARVGGDALAPPPMPMLLPLPFAPAGLQAGAAPASAPLDGLVGRSAARDDTADGALPGAMDGAIDGAMDGVIDGAPDGGRDVAPPGPDDGGRWVMAMPDVYSIRHTSVEAYLAPEAHEIKVRRADLLADLRRPAKGEAYRWLSSACWYVLAEGIAQPDEVPAAYGVLLAPADGGALQLARPAPQRALPRLPFGVWMALARAAPLPAEDDRGSGDEPAAPGLQPVGR